MGKHDKALRLDRRVAPNFADGDLPSATYVADDLTPPAAPTLPAPTNLALATYATRGTQGGLAMIVATWDLMLIGWEVDSFNIQVSTTSTFDDGTTQTYVALQESASIENLHGGRLYYVRVAAIYRAIVGPWSASASITTAQDLTPPSAPSGQAGAWSGIGDFVITWTSPDEDRYKDTEIRIYSQSGGTLLATIYDATGRYVWTAAANLAATSGAGDPSLYAELRSRSWSNALSAAVNTGLITKSAPSQPTVTLVKGATHVLAASITSARGTDVYQYEFVFKRDGATVATILTADMVAMYELSAAGDAGYHSWTVVARAKDGLGQYSSSSAASSAVVVDLLTLDALRSGLLYTDSDANTSASLASLKDAVVDSGGVSYAA